MYGSKLRVRGVHALEAAIIAPHHTEKAPAVSLVETRQIGYRIQRIAIRFASLAAFLSYRLLAESVLRTRACLRE